MFPADAILQRLNAQRGFSFTEEQIISVVSDTRYGDAYAFATLALLRPELNFQQNQFHIDHLYPSALFKRQTLTAAGLTPDEVRFALDHHNDLANLHLLVGNDNIAKQDKPLGDWLAKRADESLLRQMSLIPAGSDLSLKGFKAFHEARRQALIAQLKTLLQATATTVALNAALTAQAYNETEETGRFVTGEASI